MTTPHASRRGLLGGLIASAFAPVAGLFGAKRAAAHEPDGKVRELTIKIKAKSIRYEYQVVWRSMDGDGILFSGSFRTLDDAIRCLNERPAYERSSHPLIGRVRRGEIERRAVGEWETIQVDSECDRPHHPGRRLSDVARQDAEDYRRMDSCPNDTIRHPWHNWKEPKAPTPGPDNDPYRGIIPAGD